ncbi:recombinase family protein [Cryobacterium mannosilyticum]|uniref:Recombinase family protein n=1 Tax=Cryobacterium mannosilyticum TaxID=1259190 RepID=A0A4R8WF45_9MICO|nr:recombinase family protein [Cryobacterium mannosilyticum]
MTEFMIGYARVSTNEQDLTAQQNALERLGDRPNLIYTDHGLTGTNRARPGLREALAACRSVVVESGEQNIIDNVFDIPMSVERTGFLWQCPGPGHFERLRISIAD